LSRRSKSWERKRGRRRLSEAAIGTLDRTGAEPESILLPFCHSTTNVRIPTSNTFPTG
jgi:hypothetical protein